MIKDMENTAGCICDAWSYNLHLWHGKGARVSFNCPVHGHVELDTGTGDGDNDVDTGQTHRNRQTGRPISH